MSVEMEDWGMATADEIRAQAASVRERAKSLHDTANRADASRYVERGGQLDDATRAAQVARQTAEVARQQAQRERDTATANRKEAAGLLDEAGGEGSGNNDMLDLARTRVRQAAAATERAERAERAAAEAAARADELEQQLPDLGTVANDSSVPVAIATVANRLDLAADQLDEKARLLDEVARVEAEAVQLEADGDPTSAQHWRESAAYTRAKANAINPEISEVDPRILAAAGESKPTAEPAEIAMDPEYLGRDGVEPAEIEMDPEYVGRDRVEPAEIEMDPEYVGRDRVEPAEIEMDPDYVGRDPVELQLAPVPEDPMPFEDPAPTSYESGESSLVYEDAGSYTSTDPYAADGSDDGAAW